jgi:hypothetical protein
MRTRGMGLKDEKSGSPEHGEWGRWVTRARIVGVMMTRRARHKIQRSVSRGQELQVMRYGGAGYEDKRGKPQELED